MFGYFITIPGDFASTTFDYIKLAFEDMKLPLLLIVGLLLGFFIADEVMAIFARRWYRSIGASEEEIEEKGL